MLDSIITRLPAPSTGSGYAALRVGFARVLIMFSLFNSLIGVIATISSEALDTGGLVISVAYVLGSLLALYFSTQNQQRMMVITLLVLYLAAQFFIPEALLLNAILAVITAAIFTGRIPYLGVILAASAFVVFHMVNAMNQPASTGFDFRYVTMLMGVIIVSVSTRYLATRFQTIAESSQTSANLLQAAAATSEIIGKQLNLNELLPQSVDLIRERFAFYHVQIFLLDEARENAVLAASTGEVGQMLFARRHSLPVGSRSVIGRVTSSGQSVIANDTDSFYYRNELLPNTRSEMALPIFDGEHIIGALDVQSRRYEVFTVEVVQALQVLANQLGIAIRNARLFEEQEKTTFESQRLLQESEANLREIQRLNQQLTQAGWQDYLHARQGVSGVTLGRDTLVSDAAWTDTLLQASQARKPVTHERDGQRVIAVPMLLGNEVIGAIEVEAGDSVQESEVTDMVNAVAQRLALSLDKARLFEESQEATIREQRINAIVTRFQSVNNVDELLRITLQELSQSLGATHSSIRLGTAAVASPNGEIHP